MQIAVDYPLRIGVVSFLNMFPFVTGLVQRAPKWVILPAPPAQLLKQMDAGDCEVSMMPVFDYLANRHRFGKLRGSCIAARGRADSVLLLSDVPIGEARSLELDSLSHTSNALVQVLLKGYWKRPDLPLASEPLPLAANRHPETCVRIGDRAMQVRPQYAYCWDLGEEWHRWQNLPFVFAVWATRGNAPWEEIADFISAVRDDNLANLEERLAENESSLPEGITPEKAYSYLKETLWYKLEEEELRGLSRFAELLDLYGIR